MGGGWVVCCGEEGGRGRGARGGRRDRGRTNDRRIASIRSAHSCASSRSKETNERGTGSRRSIARCLSLTSPPSASAARVAAVSALIASAFSLYVAFCASLSVFQRTPTAFAISPIVGLTAPASTSARFTSSRTSFA